MTISILRAKDLVEIVGVSKNTIHNWVKLGIFPKPFKLGPRAIGWRVEEVEDWLIQLSKLEEACQAEENTL